MLYLILKSDTNFGVYNVGVVTDSRITRVSSTWEQQLDELCPSKKSSHVPDASKYTTTAVQCKELSNGTNAYIQCHLCSHLLSYCVM